MTIFTPGPNAAQVTRPRWRQSRLLAGIVASALAIGGLVVLDTTNAHAAEGSFLQSSVSIDDDGISGVPGDESKTDGLVAVRNSAYFSWRMSLNELKDGTITQTLPPLWSWDVASINASGMHNPEGVSGYTSTYALSNDNRTLTATVSGTGTSTGAMSVVFPRLRAVVGANATSGESIKYAPEVIVTDKDGSRPAEVRGDVKSLDVVWRNRVQTVINVGNNAGGANETFDFGAGPEDALRINGGIWTQNPGQAGDATFELGNNHKYVGTLELKTRDGRPYTGPISFTMQPDARGTYGLLDYKYDQATGKITVKFDRSEVQTQQFSLLYQVRIPKKNAPDISTTSLDNIIQARYSFVKDGDWKTQDGAPIVDATPQGVSSWGEFYYRSENTGGGGGAGAQYSYNVWDSTLKTLYNNARVMPGTDIRTQSYYVPLSTQKEGDATFYPQPLADTTMYNLWNADQMTLKDPSDIRFQVRTAALPEETFNTFVEGTDYRLYYTTQTWGPLMQRQDMNAATWTLRSDFTGALDTVSGVKVEYIKNGGVYAPEGNVDRDRFALRFNVPLTVIKELPKGTDEANAGAAPSQGLNYTHIAPVGEAVGPLAIASGAQNVFVRIAEATLPIAVNAIDGNKNPVVPARQRILAGESVRYTVQPQFSGPAVGLTEADKVVKNARFEVCLPPNANAIDLAPIDKTLWNVTISPEACVTPNGAWNKPFSGLGKLVVTPKFDLRVDKPVPSFAVDIETSMIPPRNQEGSFDAMAFFWGDGFARNGTEWNFVTVANWVRGFATAPAIARYELTNEAPEVGGGDSVSFTLNWMNYQPGPSGQASFVAVLPYNGDAAGTKLTGPLTLESAVLDMKPETGSTLQISVDPAVRNGKTGDAPAGEVEWINYADATPEQIAAATAIRVSIETLTVGPDGVGSVTINMAAPQSQAGDEIKLNATGITNIGDPGFEATLGKGQPSTVSVVDSVISGVIWNDADGNGIRAAGEDGLRAVTLTLVDAAGNPVLDGAGKPRLATTDAAGAYAFGSLTAGSYRVAVDVKTLPASEQWKYTSGTGEPISASISAVLNGEVADIDFGFQALPVGITFTKSGTAPAKIAAGEPVTFTFTVTNSGGTELQGVAITDKLAGLGAVEFGAWPDAARPGVLPVGASVSATALYPLTQADIDRGSVTNDATVTGKSAEGKSATEKAQAVVQLPGTSAIALALTGTVDSADPANNASGDPVNYEYTVTNTGSQTLTGVTLTSELKGLSTITFGTWPKTAGTLAPGESVTATASTKLTQAHINAGVITNPSAVTAQNPAKADVTAAQSLDIPLGATSGIQIVASGTVPSGISAAGEGVEYSATFTNGGGTTLTDVKLDPASPWAAKPHTIFWPNPAAPGVLEPGQKASVAFTDALTQAQVDAGKVIADDFVVVGTDPSSATVTASAPVEILLDPVVAISLTATGEIVGEPIAGSRADYEMVITNTGAATLTETELLSDLKGLGDISFGNKAARGIVPSELAPGASVTAHASIDLTQAHVDAGQIVNPVNVTGTSALGKTAVDTDEVVLALPGTSGLALVKTAELVRDGAGIDYAFTITNIGTVTVSEIVLADRMPGLGAITVVWPGAEGVLAPGEVATATAAYATTEADHGTTVTNLASVTGVDPAGDPVEASATAQTDVPKLADPPGILSLTGAEGAGLFATLVLLLLLAGAALILWNRKRERNA